MFKSAAADVGNTETMPLVLTIVGFVMKFVDGSNEDKTVAPEAATV